LKVTAALDPNWVDDFQQCGHCPKPVKPSG
jgi:hypothetical protein